MMKTKKSSGFPLILGYLGLFLVFEGIVILAPLAILAFYPNEWQGVLDFVLPGGIAIVLGLFLYFLFGFGKEKARFKKNDDALLLILIWVFAVLLGALPFYLTKFSAINFGNTDMNLTMSFSESIFESISGYATVGLTTFPSKAFLVADTSGVAGDFCPTYPAAHLFLFHRAWLQFIGGIGLILIVTSVISSKNNFRLYFAEGHSDKVVPNLAKSAKIIFMVYTGWVVLGAFSLWLCGMSPFDSLCHAISALAAGGFSTRQTNVYFYSTNAIFNGVYAVSSPIPMEAILCVLMLAGSTNFLLHTFLLRGKIKDFCKDIEIKFAFVFFVIAVLVASSSITFLYRSDPYSVSSEGTDIWTAFRYGFFLSVTSISTTGFNNFPDVRCLGEVGVFVGWLLMTVGGGAGSTAGGIKQYRVAILCKEFYWSLKYKNSSKRTINPHVIYRLGEEKEISEGTVSEARNYALLNLSFFAVGALALMFFPNLNFNDAFNEFMMGFSGTGLSFMDLNAYKLANPRGAYNGVLWILGIGMFLGRLEILPIYFAFSRVVIDPIERLIDKKKHAKINSEAN